MKYARAMVMAEVAAREAAGSMAQCWNCMIKSVRCGEAVRCWVRSSTVCFGRLYGSNTSAISAATDWGFVAINSSVSSLWA